MNLSKILSVVVSAAMLGSLAGTTASAADNKADRNYNYVALGDSIAAGFGLAGGDITQDPALVITEQLLENPVKDAYPAVFTELIRSIGDEKGFSVKGTNLASTAYRAADIEETIKTPGNKGDFASTILDGYLGEGASDVLIPYHDYYTKYLSEADLVSIQLGGNDIIMSIVPKMVFSDNAILKAAGTSLMLTLFGMDTEQAIGGGLMILQQEKDSINSDDFLEAASFMYNVSQSADKLVDESASHVKGVVEAVKELNGDADIALVGMYNPYRTADDADAVEEDVFAILGKIYAAAANTAAEGEDELTVSGKQTKNYIDSLNDKVNKITELKEVINRYNDSAEIEEILAMVEKYNDINELMELSELVQASEGNPAAEDLLAVMLKYNDIEELQSVIDLVKNYDDISELGELMAVMAKYRTANEAAAESAIAAEIAAPMAMQIAGKNVDPQMKRLNEQLRTVAEETGAIFIDVYDISPEDDFDPHPNKNGHKEIADILFNDLAELISDRMTVEEEPVEEPLPVEEITDIRLTGDINGDGVINTTDAVFLAAHVMGIRSLNSEEKKYADLDANGFVNIFDLLWLMTYITM